MSQERTDLLEKIALPLLAWYDRVKRDLPWRHTSDPYAIWVSEIMLQQTRVEAVKPYYRRFLQELPTISHLAAASEQTLLKLWEGLGYYNRVRNMQKAACTMMETHAGVFPTNYEDILALSGIGEYTAGAIASIAFGQRRTAVDGNVLRVISRVIHSYDDIASPKTTKKIQGLLQEVIPQRAGDFNQSLMELGATVCLPVGIAKCEKCPLNHLCTAFEQDTVVELPVKTPKKPRRVEDMTVLLLTTLDGRVYLQKRSEKGLLANLWEFPNVSGFLTEKQGKEHIEKLGYKIHSQEKLAKAKHIFTHIEWHMLGYLFVVDLPANQAGFYPLSDVSSKIPLPTAFKPYKDVLLQGGETNEEA